MKVSYVVAPLIFALGIGLLIAGNSQGDEVTFFGLTMSSHIVKRM